MPNTLRVAPPTDPPPQKVPTLPAATRSRRLAEQAHVDVLIVGAGLRAVDLARRLQERRPGSTCTILEARGLTDGGEDILHRLRDMAAARGGDHEILFGHRLVAAAWSSETPHWAVTVARTGTGEVVELTCSLLHWASDVLRDETDHVPDPRGPEPFPGPVTDPDLSPTTGSSASILEAAHGLAYEGRLAEADALLLRAETGARRPGDAISLSRALGLRAQVSLWAGRLAEAEAQARAAHELSSNPTTGGPFDAAELVWVRAIAALILVERGHDGEARALLEALPPNVWNAPAHHTGLLFSARGAVARAQGRTAEAIADLRSAAICGEAVRHPLHTRWCGSLAMLLAARGDRDEAIAVAGSALAAARKSHVPSAIGAALVASGVARGGADGLARLREAVDTLSSTEARREHAGALIELGAALRRSGRPAQARDPLREGLDLAARCGTVSATARARDELVAAGGRPRRDRHFLHGREALTAGEHRVARLAAEGLTNREIAERLFVTPAAVQWHLRGTFRKLDVTSRRELAGCLAMPEPSEHPVGRCA